MTLVLLGIKVSLVNLHKSRKRFHPEPLYLSFEGSVLLILCLDCLHQLSPGHNLLHPLLTTSF